MAPSGLSTWGLRFLIEVRKTYKCEYIFHFPFCIPGYSTSSPTKACNDEPSRIQSNTIATNSAMTPQAMITLVHGRHSMKRNSWNRRRTSRAQKAGLSDAIRTKRSAKIGERQTNIAPLRRRRIGRRNNVTTKKGIIAAMPFS